MTKLKATVLFDYDAEAADELTLRVGDTLVGIKKIEEGWCQGTLKGKTGMFPDNFVKIEEDKPTPVKPAPAKAKQEAHRLVKATFDYEPQNKDELKLEIGDIVEILRDDEVGWAHGRLNDKEGVFPTNFCVPYTKSPAPGPVAGDSVENEEPHNQTAAPKKVKGMGFGNIFGEGPIKLKQSTHKDETDRPVSKKAPEAKSQTTVKPQARSSSKLPTKDKTEKLSTPGKKVKPPVEKCRATYAYSAATKDELTLVLGDIITITNKNCADKGWWEGEITDSDGRKRHGVFPENFVELLPTSDEEVSEDTVEKKAPESKPKTKHTEPDTTSTKAKPSAVKISNSLKRLAPQVPPPAVKPHPEEVNDAEASDLTAVTNSWPEEQQLTHYKRAGGPKNRRKPDSAGRRERAKEVAEEVPSEVADDSPEPEPQPEEEPPPVTPKRETVRGIQVMPSPSGGTDGDKPSWMKGLKNRSSQKKASGAFAVSPTKPEETTSERPDWLSNLRKKPKAGEKGIVSPVAPKPGPGATSPKPSNHSSSMKLPSAHATPSAANHASPVRPPSPDKPAAEEKTEKAWSFKKNMKSKSENDVLKSFRLSANAPVESPTEPKHPPEVKKPPMKPPVALQPPSKSLLDKKPSAAAKPKPPPPKSKPIIPGGKPSVASSSVDELKDDVKTLKEQFANFQLESKKEISRLSKELDEEKRHRISLQAEIAQLRKQSG